MRLTKWSTILVGLVLLAAVFPEAASWASSASASRELAPGHAQIAVNTAADNLVFNGDFESPVVNGGWTTWTTGQTFGGWNVESGSVDQIGTLWSSASGSQSIDLSGSSAGIIYQDISAVTGQLYLLKFAVAGNPQGPPNIKQMKVWGGDNVLDTVSFDARGLSERSMGWAYHQYTVVAKDRLVRLRFESLTAGSFGMALDDVSLVPIPAVPTPTPTPQPVTQQIGPQGGEIPVVGGATSDGGVSVTVPPNTLGANTNVTVAVQNEAPAGVIAAGAVLLQKTVEVTTDAGQTLGQSVQVRVNLTTADLGGRDINTISGGVVVGNVVEPRPTRIIDSVAGLVEITVDHFSKFTLFSVVNSGPTLGGPPAGAILSGFSAKLDWVNPSGTTQYQLQVVPFNSDGPGVNIIRNAENSFVLAAPPDWYGLLPDMNYFWRVRTTVVKTSPVESDWTAWGSSTFRTPKVTSSTISVVRPDLGGIVSTLTPTLSWSDSNPSVFYYEVQVSKDGTFNTDPSSATAMVYWVLLHGGVTSPPDSYVIPQSFPLEAGTTYRWRVRPRVQGDGVPIGWSPTWSFATP